MACKQFKYKVGDKVRVISKFTESDRYSNFKMHNNFSYGHPVDGWAFIPPMREEYAGKVVTIKSLDVEQNCYHIDDTGLRWTDEMFEGLAVENNKIVITHDGKTTTATLYREDGSKEVATAKCCPEDTFDFNVGAKLAMDRLMKKVAPVEEWRVVDREPRVGDYIRLTRVDYPTIDNLGDIRKVDGVKDDLVYVLEKNHPGFEPNNSNFEWNYSRREYEVVEKVTTTEPKKPEPPKYFTGKAVCVRKNIPWWTEGKIYEFVNGTSKDDDGDMRSYQCDTAIKNNFNKIFLPIVE